MQPKCFNSFTCCNRQPFIYMHRSSGLSLQIVITYIFLVLIVMQYFASLVIIVILWSFISVYQSVTSGCAWRRNMPPPPASWQYPRIYSPGGTCSVLLTLKVVFESRMTWATSVPILVFLSLSVLELGPMYATDRRQTKASLNAFALLGRRHSNAILRYSPSKFTQMCNNKLVCKHSNQNTDRREIRRTSVFQFDTVFAQ